MCLIEYLDAVDATRQHNEFMESTHQEKEKFLLKSSDDCRLFKWLGLHQGLKYSPLKLLHS